VTKIIQIVVGILRMSAVKQNGITFLYHPAETGFLFS